MSTNSIDYEVSTTTREVIERVIKNVKIQNYTTHTSLAIKPGENWVSIILKIRVNGKNENGKITNLNFFVKVAPAEPGIRNFFSVREMFKTETYIYNKIIPEFIKIQIENNICNIFQPFVKFYDYTLTEFNEVIVMDDMTCLGYVAHDVQKYVDYEHALMYMQTIGKFHALSLAIQDKKPDLFRECKINTEDSVITNSEHMRKTITDLMTVGVERLNTNGYILEHQKYKQLIKKYPDIVLEVLTKRDPGSYIVINHGDCQIRNVMFKYADISAPNRPTNICLLDWQVSFIGSPACDISLFLFLNTNKALRDQYYHLLIKEYYRSFSTFLQKLGSDPNKMLPFQTLEQHLKRFSLFGAMAAIWLSLGKIYKADEHPEIFTTIDQSEMADQFKKQPRNSEVYFAIVQDILLDYLSYGYDI
ncbi:hypothetical protein RN001_000463 [Aquatica leii]|uniref:CHK kinase-like domain-containing protein n=1 Tax=Aquatica leii TaxID=1421715 RepID=A0AAN7SJ60_9COLE|nr:hypothetical protein RN001_000463 [Aquatica leii]